MSAQQSPANIQTAVDKIKISNWIAELRNPQTRENALYELAKCEEGPYFATTLWYTAGVKTLLLLEITSTYGTISPPTLTKQQYNRLSDVLTLVECVAVHPMTQPEILKAKVPLYLYPFLKTYTTSRLLERVRVYSLTLIRFLVETDQIKTEATIFLLDTDFIHICLSIMLHGTKRTKYLSTAILHMMLRDDIGLSVLCRTLSLVTLVLEDMVCTLAEQPSAGLLKQVVRCYLRLADNPQARETLRQRLPPQLRDSTFNSIMKENISRPLAKLITKLNTHS